MNANTNTAVFIFSLTIDAQAARDFAILLNEWSRKSENAGRPVRIDLNSTGGNINDCLFLQGELQRLRREGHHLTIAVYGRAASCSSWLLQCADVRIIDADSYLMFHEVSSAANGTITAMKQEIRRMEQLQHQTIGLLIRKSTKIDREFVERHIAGGGDWWITAQEAKEWELVDEIEFAQPVRTNTETLTVVPATAA
jgi:ATP-dependent protease ClpP protease subunit